MTISVHSEAPPLHQDADGALRVGDSRVLLDLVIRAFQNGATPEAIVQSYPALALSAVYASIAYYLQHQSEMDRYLVEREQQADEIQQRVETRSDLADIRARLLKRRPA